jgi:hypothetical protein
MPKAAVRLFREPQQAEKAIEELKAKGYKAEEIGVVAQENGDIVAKGATASATGKGSDLKAALAELWDTSEETLNYYQLALSWGGVVVSVHAEEARLEQARQLLRQAGAKPSAGVERHPMWSTCPPFDIASRMSTTNPIDAPMSGDFRRY